MSSVLFFPFCFTSHNKLSSLPVSMASLASLSSLKLDHNSLSVLGIELSQMKQLEEMVSKLYSFHSLFCYTGQHCVSEKSVYQPQNPRVQNASKIIRPLSLHIQWGEVKPWSNGVASRRKLKTCTHFSRDQICTQVKASFSPFGHPTQVNTS